MPGTDEVEAEFILIMLSTVLGFNLLLSLSLFNQCWSQYHLFVKSCFCRISQVFLKTLNFCLRLYDFSQDLFLEAERSFTSLLETIETETRNLETDMLIIQSRLGIYIDRATSDLRNLLEPSVSSLSLTDTI